jgi:hypothetical protein
MIENAAKLLTDSERETLFGTARPTWNKIAFVLHPIYNESIEDLVVRLKRAAKNLKISNNSRIQPYFGKKTSSISDLSIQWKGNVEVVRHPPASPLYGNVSLKEWNNLPFTNIRSEAPTTSKGLSGWPRAKSCSRRTCNTLYDLFELRVPNKKDTLCLFHGTIGRFENNILKGIRWTEGIGVLGPGFYMSHNPNVSKSYACRAANIRTLKHNESVLLLEIEVTNASLIKRVYFDSVNFMKPNKQLATFVLNEETGYDGQVALRGAAISKYCHVRAVHSFDPKGLIVTGTKDTKREPCLG